MMSTRLPTRIILASVIAVGWAATHRADGSDAGQRPELVVADAASGCPSVEGAFVALLDEHRGILLLSAAPFPGGRVVGDARGSSMTVSLPGTSPWVLDRAGSREGQVPLWGARYPFLAQRGSGCVGFDKQRWSAEGDLVTYLRWLIEEIYLDLPPLERSRRPDFRLSDRQVSLRVERSGYGAIRLTGKEGSTLACRWADSERIYLFMPFVLDAPNERLAVKLSYTDGEYFSKADKLALDWVVVSLDQPGTLADPPLTISVEGISRSSSE